ncbi:hypothetical protein Tco_0725500 [Tanacetum coccineum]|uniref:Uncharacterized protein n=1 Tax=Tanacetum coccineum TaxID=301880 RepID=A0ABQ4YD04_9ASTR
METMMIQFIWDDPDDDEEDKENKDEEDEDEERREDHLAPPNSTVLLPCPFTRGEVERLLAMPTPPPSPPISLSPPFAGERLARIASTQALVDAVGESSTARPIEGRGVDYGFFSTLDAEERRRGIREVGYGLSQAVPYELQIHREQVHETRSQMQQTEMAELRETERRQQQRRARQPGPDDKVPDHQDASRDADSHI